AAISLDGRIATETGASRWISSASSRHLAHRLRDESDAILVGAHTVSRDDPALTVRGPRGGRRAPSRVVLDSLLRIDERARVLSRAAGESVIIYCTRSVPERKARRLGSRGVTVVRVAADRAGRVSLAAALRDLARRGVHRLLVEGGGTLIGSAFA